MKCVCGGIFFNKGVGSRERGSSFVVCSYGFKFWGCMIVGTI